MPDVMIRRSWVVPAVVICTGVVVAAGGAIASVETGTVGSFPRGLWWSLSLMTTVGFIGPAPTSAAGALVSITLMLLGFLLLAMVSAALASIFVREDSSKFEETERSIDLAILDQLGQIRERLTALERRLPAPEPRGPADSPAE